MRRIVKPYRVEEYNDIHDVLRHGKFKGHRIIDVLRISRNYIFDAIHRGSIVMPPAMVVKCKEARRDFIQGKMGEIGSRTKSCYDAIASNVIDKAKKMSADTREPCIHEKCWCAHNGCQHKGRKTCDADIHIEEGKSEVKYKYASIRYRYGH